MGRSPWKGAAGEEALGLGLTSPAAGRLLGPGGGSWAGRGSSSAAGGGGRGAGQGANSRGPALAGDALGEIACILKDKGELDEALKLHREALAVCEALGARRDRSVALFDVAQIHLARKEIPAALPTLRESYEIALALGIALVGEFFAVLLLQTGAKKDAEPIVARAAEALTLISETTKAAALRTRLADTPPASP